MTNKKLFLEHKHRTTLREMRQRVNLKIDEVSAELGKSRSWLGNIERGNLISIKQDDLIKLFLLYTDYSEAELRNLDLIDNFMESGELYSNIPEAVNWYEQISLITESFFEYFNASKADEEIEYKLINIRALLRCVKNKPGATSLFLGCFPLLERIFENYDDLPTDQYLFRFMKLTKNIEALLEEEIKNTF